ncbi:MAG TPA: substrate-binding domain-containing protein [Terracidiphilus sp.]|nr:substrate-binding domain-containing protein [Terracidiphilus sp.]HUX43718.1 substrate-binding domain-containing protein [Terracidiphilus sp.]
MHLTQKLGALLLLFGCALGSPAQTMPPWSKGANNPAADTGYVFHVPDVDNVPDLHGNPANARLVLFIGGNQFFVLPQLVAVFEREHPELKGHIFYETLPPGILRRQIAANNTITLGNLTIQVQPDVYEAGARALSQMQSNGQVTHVVEYATNNLAIMVRAGNPEHIHTLQDLSRPDLRLSMPNPEWEGVAKQIANSLRKAGGVALENAVYRDKVKNGTTRLTEIHHRQTPMRILNGTADAGVTWASEVRFQQSIANPIEGVAIPAPLNTTAVYAGARMQDAPHPKAAEQWLAFLQSEQAQAIYRHFGFQPVPRLSK